MKTIDKFLLKSYLGPMFMTFFIVMFILLMQFLWKWIDELIGKGLPLSVIGELLSYTAVTLMPMGLPLATLLAAIMTMGNLGENNELLAMKSAGISLPRIMRPTIIVAVLISIASFFLINNFVPYSFQRMNALIYDIRQQKQEIEFRDGVFTSSIDNVTIRVGHQDRETRGLTDVRIYDTRKYDAATTTVADSGFIELSKDKRFLLIRLYNGQTYEYNRDMNWYDAPMLNHQIFEKQDAILALSGFNFERSDVSIFGNINQAKNIKELKHEIDSVKLISETGVKKFSVSFLTDHLYRRDQTLMNDSLRKTVNRENFHITPQTIDTLPAENRRRLYEIATNTANDIRQYLSYEQVTTKEALIQYYRLEVELHKKLSLPISIIIFFLIGAPLGAIIRKGGLGTPIVISVTFFIFYYIITITGEKLVREGAWPPWLGMWISTFILFPLAVFLTYKATNDSNLFNIEWYMLKISKIKNTFASLTKKMFSKNNNENGNRKK